MTEAPARLPASRYVLFLAPAVLGCLLDLWTKSWTFAHPEQFQGKGWWLWEGHAGIQLSLNEGALFGMGQGQVWLFAVCALVAIVGIPLWLFRYRAAEDSRLTFAMGAIMGGVLGNLYDRMGMHGLTWDRFYAQREGPVYAVRDWILVQWDDRWVWPNFNIADTLLVCGAGTLMLLSFFGERDQPQGDDEA
ncbi:signal peptidase II [Adhaeretor mobilis]|uniref:Lipoprotein signal peptidase n=1 Tax=Adhaeretor mobilis TaxID=1930276 RepID=A0A517MYA2_9BACT|nr:signal peptidase II [Adhaeretor mobilis]QDS99862.1 lipoprotein signal peptidase [Adhaeretor mobilis]